MPLEKKDEDRDDWFEVLGLEWDATGEMVSRAYRKLSLKWHPDKNRDDPKAPERFQLITKAKEFLTDEPNRTKLAAKKRKEAERDKYNKKRFSEMDKQRKKQKVDLEAREAQAVANRTAKGGGGGGGRQPHEQPGINTNVLDELRKLGQRQREEEARRIEEALRRAQATPAMPMDEDDDDDDASANGGGGGDLAARMGIGVSAEIKVKWRRSTVADGSHSDDSLWKLFSRYGQIETVELTGTKGNTASIKYEKREGAEAAVRAYELSDDMRVTIPADKKYKVFKQVFDPNAASKAAAAAASSLFGAAYAVPPPPPQRKYDAGFENDTLAKMRQAAEKRKLAQQQQQQQQPPPPPPPPSQGGEATPSPASGLPVGLTAGAHADGPGATVEAGVQPATQEADILNKMRGLT